MNTKFISVIGFLILVTEKDWKQKPIWAILFIISLIIIVVLIVILCVVCKNSSRMLYMPTDTSSLATSLSSLLLTSKH